MMTVEAAVMRIYFRQTTLSLGEKEPLNAMF